MTSLLPLTLGFAMTLALTGYRFGESNHAVYLLDALRKNDPTLLANDWWTQSTLQYHFVFTKLSAWLMRVGMIEPVFLAGYVTLVALMHVAWRRLTIALGGTDLAYLVSVILFQLLAGGTGLGMYQFTQDSSFLPSNVANVAMLWGMMLWVMGRRTWAGFAFGVAGLFHLNHSLVGIGLWIGLWGLEYVRRRRLTPSPWYSGERAGRGPEEDACRETRDAGSERFLRASSFSHHESFPGPLSPTLSPAYRGEGVRGTLLLLALSAPAIIPAVRAVLSKTASLPLREFVELYVRLRHPHHYDPSSWPVALWLTFLVPVVVAVFAYRMAIRESDTPERRRAADAFSLFLAMLALALFGAGMLYVSEPLIQMSLYRFSIFPKLLSCVAVAWVLTNRSAALVILRALVLSLLFATTGVIAAGIELPQAIAANMLPVWMFTLFATAALLRPRVLGWGRVAFGTLSACVVVSLVLTWNKLGLTHEGFRGDDAGYLQLCHWVERNTPKDAVFLVPPDEQSFRLHARRAIVVNFKNVPQLSGELGEWRDRLEAVLDVKDIRRAFPRPFHRTLDAMRARYAELSPDHLTSVARRYDARYVVTVRPLAAHDAGASVFSESNGQYFLYDLGIPTSRPASEAAK